MKTRFAVGALLVFGALWGCATYSPERERGSQDPYANDLRVTLQDIPQINRLPTTGPATPEVIILEQDDPTLDLRRVGRRAELPHGGSLNTRVQDTLVPLPLKHTDVQAQLTLYVGSVTVTQQYHNPYNGKIEALYVFPLPDDAAIRDFIMQIGDRKIRGIIREREEAQRIYREARRQGYVASLLTQERPNIFTQAVANIEPGKQIDISITYFHTLRYSEGTFEFVFPMVVGPRYNPAGFHDGVGAVGRGAPPSGQKTDVAYLRPGEISAADITLDVRIDAGSDLEEISSPTHAIRSERPGPGQARVTLSPNDRIPNRDFVLRYRIAGRQIRAALAATRGDDGGYFTLMIHPPEKLADVPRTPREMVFVIDCSGSMQGRPLDVAKRALAKCLRRLDPGDTFQIYAFSDHVWSMSPAPLAATAENVREGLQFVQYLQTEGGTEMEKVVRQALDAPKTDGRYRIVSFMTDGYIGNDREIVGLVRTHLGSSRVFSFGVGDSVNRYLLEAMARVGRGASTFITMDESTERAADELYERIEHPALSDLKIDWGTMAAAEVHPQPLPDLFVGRPVILSGRFKGRGIAKIQISGRSGTVPFETSLSVNLDDPGVRHASIASIWARTKIATLYDRAAGSTDSAEFHQEIRATALKYGLLSDATAFVAVDSLTQTQGSYGTTVSQPVPVPSGVQYPTTVEKK